MTTQDRVTSLQERHHTLDHLIKEEQSRPSPDDGMLHELKREKLKIKDQIAALS